MADDYSSIKENIDAIVAWGVETFGEQILEDDEPEDTIETMRIIIEPATAARWRIWEEHDNGALMQILTRHNVKVVGYDEILPEIVKRTEGISDTDTDWQPPIIAGVVVKGKK